MIYKFSTRQKIYLFFKRVIDIFGSVLGLIVLSPTLLICGIVTKCSSKGPILFRQERVGFHEKAFKLMKFRSMRTDAPQIPPEQMTVEFQQSLITPWGKFMRKTSLDEIPQLFNILAGHMSFIGPRPGQTAEHEADLIEARKSYAPSAYEVKPGISGMAQIYMHRDHDPQKKAMYDSEYVEKLSFWLDLKLFVMSFLVIFGLFKGR